MNAEALGAAQVRIVHRVGAAGAVELDWPVERLEEALADAGGTTWVDILDEGDDQGPIERLFAESFRFHPLAIDDALQEVNTPKLDDWGEYLCTVFHAASLRPGSIEIELSELDVFLGRNYLVTYHTQPLAPTDLLRRFLERDAGARLKRGADHLLYHLLDLGVDGFLPVFERLDETIDSVQDAILTRSSPRDLQTITQVKHAALRMHRILVPQREVLNRLARDPFALIDGRDRVYFRDVYDHLVRLHDISETLRDQIASSLDMYLSATANRTNEVMKTLAIVSVLSLPLNVLVGFFGMNFFGGNIELRDMTLPHEQLFILVCVVMLLAPWLMWALGRYRKWF